MRRLLLLAVLVSALVAPAPGVQAQVTTDQLNKLSLEALTAPPARAAPVPRPSYARGHTTAYHRPAAGARRARFATHAHRFRFAARSRGTHLATRSALYRGRPTAQHTAKYTAQHTLHSRHAPPRRLARR